MPQAPFMGWIYIFYHVFAKIAIGAHKKSVELIFEAKIIGYHGDKF